MAVRAEDRDGAIVAHGIAAADAAAVEIGMCVRSAMAGPVRKASAVCEVWWLCSGGWGVGGGGVNAAPRHDGSFRFGARSATIILHPSAGFGIARTPLRDPADMYVRIPPYERT